MDFRKKFAVAPGSRLKLAKLDPADKGSEKSAETAAQAIECARQNLSDMQTLLYAERKRSLLVVLQALDAGGKDGTIIHVMGAWNPQGATVTAFKEPTPQELAHDVLWRVHIHAPGRGEIAIFNRSHYEAVLVERVHKLIDKPTWKTRYRRIREFEAELADHDTHIVKFYLHISKEEQLARFAQRLEDRTRNWKISEADYTERAHWDEYIAAYEDAISATSTKYAPWYVIPANHKWFRDLAVSRILADTMEDFHMSYPKPSVDLAKIRRDYHAAAEENSKRTK
ncbi:MAG: PPK2 family polyphosphate kinase [Methylovirgula sp.]